MCRRVTCQKIARLMAVCVPFIRKAATPFLWLKLEFAIQCAEAELWSWPRADVLPVQLLHRPNRKMVGIGDQPLTRRPGPILRHKRADRRIGEICVLKCHGFCANADPLKCPRSGSDPPISDDTCQKIDLWAAGPERIARHDGPQTVLVFKR